jgi:hypothetical protein
MSRTLNQSGNKKQLKIYTVYLLNKLTAVTENHISENKVINAVNCTVPYTGPSNQEFQF